MPGQEVAIGADIVRVGGRYRVRKLLGAGAFGTVYLGRDIKNGRDVAMKIEVDQWDSKLDHESDVYQAISGIRGIPKMLWYGMEGRYNVMVLSRLGRTFEDMVQLSMLDANTVFAYAKQMLSVLKSLHDHHYVHLDVKPDNFMIGIGDRSNQVFLIDFGLTRLFCNTTTYRHNAQFKGLNVIGTSVVYVIVYLVKGWLPWQGIAVRPGQVHHKKVLKSKQVTMAETLCEGLPQPFIKFIQHIWSLGFEDTPDYRYLHSLLVQCILPLDQMPPTTQTEPLLVTG